MMTLSFYFGNESEQSTLVPFGTGVYLQLPTSANIAIPELTSKFIFLVQPIFLTEEQKACSQGISEGSASGKYWRTRMSFRRIWSDASAS